MKLWFAVALIGCSSSHDPWTKVELPEFRIEMPGVAKVETKPQVAIPPTPVTTYLVDRGARGDFQVATYEIMVELEDKAAESAGAIDCLGAIKDSGYAITDQHGTALNAARGYAVTGESAKGFEDQRCYVSGKRMFHLTAVGPNDAAMKADAKRFLTSFAIK